MIYINKFIKFLIINIIICFILSTISYFNIISDNSLNIIMYISLFTTIFIESFSLGKIKEKKGLLEGIKLGVITSLIFFIISILFTRNFKLSKLIYYLIIILISVSGSILGVNKKSKQ